MAKMTIAQLREKALEVFNENHIHDIKKAKSLVNRFYRLSAIEYRVFMWENDSYAHDKWYTKEEAEKRDRMLASLQNDLSAYGLRIAYYGIYPRLEERETQREALTAWYYNK